MGHSRSLVLVTVCAAALLIPPAAWAQRAGSQPVAPYKVVGNIYYVGSVDVSAHIIATPQGLILIDTGTTEMGPIIRSGIEKLGFKVGDVKIMLSSHAHWDHVEGHAVKARKFEFIGNDRLVLTPVGGANPPAHLTWERIKE